MEDASGDAKDMNVAKGASGDANDVVALSDDGGDEEAAGEDPFMDDASVNGRALANFDSLAKSTAALEVNRCVPVSTLPLSPQERRLVR